MRVDPTSAGDMSAPLAPTPEAFALAVAELRSGRTVAFPTETVYGLGADASDPDAVAELYRLKGRPRRHPVIVHLASSEQLEGWAAAPGVSAERLIEAFWPGPLTLVLAAGPLARPWVTGGQRTVGVRSPSHPVARELLARFGGGVAAPSANRFGRISPTRAAHVASEFADAERPPVILDGGASQVGLESTILDLSGDSPRLLRPGAIGVASLAEVLGAPPTAAGDDAPRAPGRLASHYAPTAPTHLLAPDALEAELSAPSDRVGVVSFGRRYPQATELRDLGSDPAGAARGLYAAMRELDAAVDRILIEIPPASPEWLAIADRVARAAAPLPDPRPESSREEP